MSYKNHLAEHMRLAILRLLAKSGGNYSANDSILTDALPLLGFTAGRDAVRAQIDWLADTGLVSSEDLEGLLVVTLTTRGLDVAEGRAAVSGVKRPSPKG